MPYDLVLRNCRIVNQGSILSCDLAISDGVVKRIAKHIEGEASEILNCSGKLIFPGLIDMHCHLRDFDLSYKETIERGTLAAAAGGFVALVDMPNTKPPVASLEIYDKRIELVRRRASVDVGVSFCATNWNLDELRRVLERRSPGYIKIYTVGDYELGASWSKIPEILRTLSKSSCLIGVHAEDESLFNHSRAKNLEEYDRSRPLESEISAIARFLAISKISGVDPSRIVVCHVTSRQSAELARILGANAEACPHHLLLDTSMDIGSLGKVNPPLRSREIREDLILALLENRISHIATDHAPHSAVEKEREFEEVPPGIASIEIAFRLLYTLFVRENIPITLLTKLMSTNPAMLLGLYPELGSIREGSQASFFLVNPKVEERIERENLVSGDIPTPYEGFEVICRIERTYLRGNEIFSDGEIIEKNLGEPLW